MKNIYGNLLGRSPRDNIRINVERTQPITLPHLVNRWIRPFRIAVRTAHFGPLSVMIITEEWP